MGRLEDNFFLLGNRRLGSKHKQPGDSEDRGELRPEVALLHLLNDVEEGLVGLVVNGLCEGGLIIFKSVYQNRNRLSINEWHNER